MAYEGKISNELDGYSLTLPAGWRRIEVSPDDWAATIDQIADAPTRDMLTHYLQVARLSGVDFLAVRSADPATVGFATNVTVTVSELLDSSAQDLLEMSREQLQGIGIEQIDDKFVDLPAGSALHMAYVMPAEQFGLAYAVEQYTFFDADHFYTIALAGKLPPDIAADALAMATSFAFGPRLAP